MHQSVVVMASIGFALVVIHSFTACTITILLCDYRYNAEGKVMSAVESHRFSMVCFLSLFASLIAGPLLAFSALRLMGTQINPGWLILAFFATGVICGGVVGLTTREQENITRFYF
jgi:mannose/fructose/N-acetylgalactosamine-specific phosphotransferase system component IID